MEPPEVVVLVVVPIDGVDQQFDVLGGQVGFHARDGRSEIRGGLAEAIGVEGANDIDSEGHGACRPRTYEPVVVGDQAALVDVLANLGGGVLGCACRSENHVDRPPTRPVGNLGTHWNRIRREAGLPDVRLHDCCHTWASVAAMNGVDMVTIAKLLGHALIETTERYTHFSDRSVVDAADRVSNRIHAALAGKGAGNDGGGNHAEG